MLAQKCKALVMQREDDNTTALTLKRTALQHNRDELQCFKYIHSVQGIKTCLLVVQLSAVTFIGNISRNPVTYLETRPVHCIAFAKLKNNFTTHEFKFVSPKNCSVVSLCLYVSYFVSNAVALLYSLRVECRVVTNKYWIFCKFRAMPDLAHLANRQYIFGFLPLGGALGGYLCYLQEGLPLISRS